MARLGRARPQRNILVSKLVMPVNPPVAMYSYRRRHQSIWALLLIWLFGV